MSEVTSFSSLWIHQ